MAARECVSITHDDITTDEITTEQDLFYAAVKQEVEAEGSCLPANTARPTRVKGEPVDYSEMSTQDDTFSGNDNIQFEEVLVDPPPMKTETNNDPWGYLQQDTLDQVDPLLLPDDSKREAKTEVQFAETVTTREDPWGCLQQDTLDQVDPLLLPDDLKCETKTDTPLAETVTIQCQKVTGPSTTQGQKVTITLCSTSQGKTTPGVACSKCRKVFVTKDCMEQHALSHSAKKLLECSECDFRTARSSFLEKHIRTHTGEKPYFCTVCDYRTAYSTNIAAHIMTHKGEKPYACIECDFRTAYKSCLASHKKTHTGEKLYACTQCSYRTPYSRYFVRHKRKITHQR